MTLEVVGPRTAGFRGGAAVSALLPGFPAGVDIVEHAGYAPLVVTMPHGDEFAAAVSAHVRAKVAGEGEP